MIPESSNPNVRKKPQAAPKASSGYGLWLLFVFTLLTGLYWGWTLLTDQNILPIRVVKIEASYQHVDRQTLETLIVPYVEVGFFNMNAAKLKHQIAQMPWVSQVFVNRVWPDKVVVRVVERQAIARWNENQLLSDQNKLFAPSPDSFPPGLPWFKGPDSQIGNVVQTYQQAQAVLSPLSLRVAQIALDERGSWQLELENGVKLLLGNNDLLKRLNLFVKVYAKVFATTDVAGTVVDLRYPNGLAVKTVMAKQQ